MRVRDNVTGKSFRLELRRKNDDVRTWFQLDVLYEGEVIAIIIPSEEEQAIFNGVGLAIDTWEERNGNERASTGET